MNSVKTFSRFFSKITIMASVLASLLACSAQPPVPEDHFYQLPKTQVHVNKHVAVDTLSVKRFVTDGLHSDRALLFSEADQNLRLKQYHYHHWSDSPPRMLQEHLISAMRSNNIAKVVMNYDPAQRASYQLSGKIRHFEQIQRGNKSKVLVDVELRLDDKNGKPLLIKDYRQTQIAHSDVPHELVKAFGLALDKIYSEFIADWEKNN